MSEWPTTRTLSPMGPLSVRCRKHRRRHVHMPRVVITGAPAQVRPRSCLPCKLVVTRSSATRPGHSRRRCYFPAPASNSRRLASRTNRKARVPWPCGRQESKRFTSSRSIEMLRPRDFRVFPKFVCRSVSDTALRPGLLTFWAACRPYQRRGRYAPLFYTSRFYTSRQRVTPSPQPDPPHSSSVFGL